MLVKPGHSESLVATEHDLDVLMSSDVPIEVKILRIEEYVKVISYLLAISTNQVALDIYEAKLKKAKLMLLLLRGN